MVKGKTKELVFYWVEKSRQEGVFFLPFYSVIQGTKGGDISIPCFGFQQPKTERKNREGEEKKKRERREEKRKNKATSLGVFVSKVYPSVCMVFLAILMVEWLGLGRGYIQIF